MESNDLSDEAWEQRCGVMHKAWVQVRYHKSRQRFFDLADKLTKTATIVIGGLLLGKVMQDRLPLAASVISAIGLLSLIFGYGDRKQIHKELAEQAAALVAAIEEVPAGQLDTTKTAKWSADYLRLCMKAPPPLRTLTLICEHEQACADGHHGHVKLPVLPRRWTASFLS